MGCESIRTPTFTGFTCGPRPRVKPCWECWTPHQFLCDGPSRTGKGTCNRPLCTDHRTPAGAGVDYCKEHAKVLRLF